MASRRKLSGQKVLDLLFALPSDEEESEDDMEEETDDSQANDVFDGNDAAPDVDDEDNEEVSSDDDVLYQLADHSDANSDDVDGLCEVANQSAVSDDDNLSYDSDSDDSWARKKLNPQKQTSMLYRLYQHRHFCQPTDLLIFFAFFDDSVMQWLVMQTNMYAMQKRIKKWSDTNVTELKAFIGILIAFGLHVLPSIDLYWSSDPLFHVTEVAKVMTVKRFKKLLQGLHVNNNSCTPKRGTAEYDKLYKVRPLVTKLNKEFTAQCVAASSQSVDEAMIGFKGRSSLKQYMPMKPTKRGYKVWVRSDHTTGYVYECEIYTGKAEGNAEYGLGGRVVTDLTRSIMHNNIHVTFDNFFASFPLMQKLYDDGIYATATVRSMRKQLPDIAREKLSLQRGESEWRTRSHTGYVQWKDTRFVHVLSTAFAPHETVDVQRRQKDGTAITVTCPKPIAQYTKRMGGVDRFDQKRQSYTVSRKSRRWWIRIFYFFLDTSIVNAHILHTSVHVDDAVSQLKFRTLLFRELVRNYSSRQRLGSPSYETFRPARKHCAVRKPLGVPDVIRLSVDAGHFPQMMSSYRRCRLCSSRKNNKRSRYQCRTCLVPLCTAPCFAKFHATTCTGQ